MRSRSRPRFTYAPVMATTAVIAAVGAGAYAVAAIPDRKGRINSCYVSKGKSKGSLRLLVTGAKCRRGERRLAWNQQGPQGPTGARGPQGATGTTGPAGPSDAYNQGLSAGGPGLTLAPGNYYVRADVQLSNNTANNADVTCTLTLPGNNPGSVRTTTMPAGAKDTLALANILVTTTPGVANVSCTGADWGGLIIALKVGLAHAI